MEIWKDLSNQNWDLCILVVEHQRDIRVKKHHVLINPPLTGSGITRNPTEILQPACTYETKTQFEHLKQMIQ